MSFYETQNDFINNLTLMFYSLIRFFGEVSRIFKLHLKLFKVSLGVICHWKAVWFVRTLIWLTSPPGRIRENGEKLILLSFADFCLSENIGI